MKHLRRAGALLIAIIVVTFILPRFMPSVESLEVYGFYRGGNPTQEWANQPVQYVDSAKCQTCHKDKYDAWSKADHQTVVCETCHGPGREHVSFGAKPVIDTSSQQCAVCHQKLESRPKQFPQVDVSQHAGTSQCTTCHNPHQPALSTGAPAVPHDLEGRSDCLACHKTGAIKPYPQDHDGRDSQSGISCHRGK